MVLSWFFRIALQLELFITNVILESRNGSGCELIVGVNPRMLTVMKTGEASSGRTKGSYEESNMKLMT